MTKKAGRWESDHIESSKQHNMKKRDEKKKSGIPYKRKKKALENHLTKKTFCWGWGGGGNTKALAHGLRARQKRQVSESK